MPAKKSKEIKIEIKIEKNKETEKDKERAKERKRIEGLSKKYKSEVTVFGDPSVGNIEWLDTGIPVLNEMISGKEDGGFPRGRMIEISGPEGSGKTFLLSKTYARCQELGLKCMHYDAEGSYSREFAKIHGVDPDLLGYTQNGRCEEVMGEIEGYLLNNDFDIIGVDSLASLVPIKTYTSDMGKPNFGNLAHAIAACYPRVNEALKRSRCVLVFINQLRDNLAAASKPWLDPEKTPGGRTMKFFASVRLTARPKNPLKTDRPDMFSGARRVGHVLNMKTIKNKVYEPFHTGLTDLMYRLPSKAILAIEKAIDNDVIERQRNKSGELFGRKLIYKDLDFIPEVKYDPHSTCAWLRENSLLIPLLVEMGFDDLDEFVEAEDLTEEEVSNYLIDSSMDSEESQPEEPPSVEE